MSVRERWRKIKLHKGTENNGGEGSARVGGKWLGWTLGVAWGRRATEELGEERPEGGGPGRDIRWDGAPGCRTSQWGCLRQKAASTNGRTGEGWELHAGCTGEMGTGEVLLFYFHAGITTEMCMVPDTIHQQGRNCGSRRERWFAPREGLVRGRHPPPRPQQEARERMAGVQEAAARGQAHSSWGQGITGPVPVGMHGVSAGRPFRGVRKEKTYWREWTFSETVVGSKPLWL